MLASQIVAANSYFHDMFKIEELWRVSQNYLVLWQWMFLTSYFYHSFRVCLWYVGHILDQFTTRKMGITYGNTLTKGCSLL